MQRTWRAARIIILVVAMCFSFAACGDSGGDDNNGNGGGGFLGSTLTISNAQVYTVEWNGQEGIIIPINKTVDLNYVEFIVRDIDDSIIENLNYFFDTDRTLTLKNGKLNINLKKPRNLVPVDIYFGSNYAISRNDANIIRFNGFSTYPKHNNEDDRNATLNLWSAEAVQGYSFWYSDKDVTINGLYDPSSEPPRIYELDLKTGWNSVINCSYSIDGYDYVWGNKTEKISSNAMWGLIGDY
jgi:hypothetical protein